MKKGNVLFAITLISMVAMAAHGAEGGEHGAIGHEEGGIPLKTIGIQAINLGILLVALFFLTKKSIVDAFAARQVKFNAEALKTAAALKVAEQELQDVKSRLSNLESSEQSSLQKAQTEAEDVRKKLVLEAEAQAKKIKEDSGLLLGAEMTKARTEIRNQIIETSLAAAQASIQQSSATITKKSETGFLQDLGQVKA